MNIDMKKYFFLLFGLLFLIGMSACSKCATCEKTGMETETFCSKDFGGKTSLYNSAVSTYQNLGYTCK
jgi:hypothetical protein